MKKRIGWLAILLAVVSLAFNFFFYRQVAYFKKVEGKYKVAEVLDGDSFIIDLGQTVRLANLDAPELEFCYGKEAKENIERLILEKYVRIEKTGRGQFGRIMGMVYLNNQLVNEIVAKNGWAKYATGGPANEERALIRKAAKEAKEKSLGVWNPKCYQKENLENPDCLIKGNIGKSDGRKVYHFPGCAEYERTIVELDLGEEWFCTEEEVQKAGYQKSKHCYGKKYED